MLFVMKKALIGGILMIFILLAGCERSQIKSFEDCVQAGYPVMESYPRQCRLPDGTTFVEKLSDSSASELCIAQDGEKMNLSEAREMALTGECSQGGLKGSYVCNAVTGTWWLDLDIEMTGCSPACVVDVSNKSAEINWRCTGLNP